MLMVFTGFTSEMVKTVIDRTLSLYSEMVSLVK